MVTGGDISGRAASAVEAPLIVVGAGPVVGVVPCPPGPRRGYEGQRADGRCRAEGVLGMCAASLSIWRCSSS